MKKKVFSLMMTLLLGFFGLAQAQVSLPYSEGFENGIGSWTMSNCHSSTGVSTSYTAYEGSGLFRFYYTSNFPQYLISPELTGGENGVEVSFYYARYSASYEETFQVGYSTTTDATSAFTWEPEVTVTNVYSGAGWLEYTTTCPAGTKYVAVKCTSDDQFYLFLDNFTFTAVAGGSQGGETVEVTIGDPTSTTTNSYLPGYSLYEYAISQQIYTADEIGVAGTINTLTLWLKNTSSYARNINVYMKETDDVTFASTSAWVSMTASDMVASFTMENGVSSPIEKAISLTTPFAYSGNGNLVICFQDVTGSWSSGLGGVEMDANGNQAHYAYQDGSVYDPSVAPTSSYNYVNNKKNVVRLSITTAGGGSDEPGYQNGLHTLAYYGVGAEEDLEEYVDLLVIERPNGAWMEPYHFNLYNDGSYDVDVALIDFLHNNGYFSMAEGTEYPFTVAHNGRPGVDLYINTNTEWTSTDVLESLLAVNTTERSTHLFDIVAAPYQPYCPDVWELAYDLGTIGAGFTWRNYMSEIWDGPDDEMELHQNYDLPDYEENIPDGYDAVMKFTVDRAMMLNARVVEGYENGKVALYTEDFGGEAGPMADNNYTERPFNGNGGGGSTGGSGEVTVYGGEPQTTNYYIPVYGLWMDSYTRNEMIYPAVALSDLNGKDINSMTYYISSSAWREWTGADFTVYMKEVSATTLSDYIGNAGATTVYTGSLDGTGEEMTINFTTPYHYNGGNLLVGIMQNATGQYASCYFYGQTVAGASGYGYNSNGAANATFSQNNFLPKTTFAYGNRSNRDVILTEGFENGLNGWTVDGHSSSVVTNGYAAHTGSYAFGFHWTTTPPQYLISPELTGTGNGVDVSFYYYNQSTYYTETFQVGYSTTNNSVNAFTFGPEITATNTWTEYTNSFPAGTKYIAVKNTSYDAYWMLVDDFTFTAVGGGQGQGGDDAPQGPVFSAGPAIEGLNILPGTYYLVASSTEEDYEVQFGLEDLPCPLDHALVVYPEDNADHIQPNSVTLKWQLSPYCTEYRLWFSSTYWPDDEEEHPATLLVDWTSNLAEQYTVHNLYNNTNYFWRIDQRTNGGEENGGCYTQGDVWGFTTKLNIPNLTVTPDRIYEGETVTLSWNHILDRTYRSYRIYKDGELIHTTPVNQVVTSWEVPASELEYNYPGTYTFNVTAVYDEGESDFSNGVDVTVGGYSANNGINGYVYEQDYTTPIVGATVTITGTDALMNQTQTYTVTTDANGYYEVQVYEGTYTSAIATMDGYQDATPYENGPDFYVGHNAHHDNMNFMMDEVFFPPVHVCARPMYIPGVQGDTLVQVYWSFPNTAQAFEAQIGENVTTTTYMPYHTLWNNSLSTALYRADELEAAGVTAAPMSSLSWYAVSTPGEAQQGITIWMANVSDQNVTANSPLTAGMTKVYTGGTNPVTGWNEFVFNQGNFAWDGSSNILIVVQRLNGSWTSSTSWAAQTTNFTSMSYDYDDYEVYNAETTSYGMSTGTTRPMIIMRSGRSAQAEMPRSLHHFNIYRTDCYNDGPYTDENTDFLSTAWVPDTSYFDVSWPAAEPGVYKFGVSAVYSGNRVEYPAEERESEIIWHTDCAPCIDKDMQTDITVNVVCNSADSPEGCVVSFTNLNEGEQNNYPQPSITLDDSGFQAINPFRKGDYLVRVYLPGYELIEVEESIWGHRDLRYVLTEIIYNVKNIYVSRTGWAMWEPETWEDYPIPAGGGATTIIDFETGNFNQFNFDNNVSAYPWAVVQEGQNGGYCMKSTNAGMASTTSAIEATVNYTSAGTVSFDANCMGEGTGTAWDKCIFKIDGVAMFTYGAHVTGWNAYVYEVAAGEHTFRWEYTKDSSVNPTGDAMLVDNINFNIGGTREGERHLEGFKVMCTSIDGEQIFNHNTPVDQPFCQLSTVDPWSGAAMLIEGEHYLVKVATIYSTGESPWSEPVEWVYEPCDHWGPVDEVTAATQPQGNHIEWVFEHGYNPYAPANPDDPTPDPSGNVTVVLSYPEDIWEDGTGYQMLLDADATACGVDFQETGGYGPTNFSNFEYLIPENAGYPANSGNIVGAGASASIQIPAGTYDWVILNPYPASNTQYIAAGNGNVGGRQNDYVFEAGMTYTFTISSYYPNDGVDVVITDSRGIVFSAGNSFVAANNVDARRNEHQLNVPTVVNYEMTGSSLMFNITSIERYDERVYVLYNLMKDGRFDVVNAEAGGHFIISANDAYTDLDLEEAFVDFREEVAAQFAQMEKLEIVELVKAYKEGMPGDFMASLMSDMIVRSRENDHCETALPFCTEMETYQYPASSGQPSTWDDPLSTTEGGPIDFSCLGSEPNQAWYYFRIGEPGPLNIRIETNPSRDVDFCCWGPFEDPISPCPYGLSTDKVVSCSYSAAHEENCQIPSTYSSHVPETGEYYILVLTNYSAQPMDVTFWSIGTATTDCNIVNPTYDILGFLVTLDGEYLAFVGPDVREYDDLGEYGDHEYCVRPIYPGLQQLPDSNFYFSMGCPVCANTSGDITCEPGAAIYGEPVETGAHIWWGGGDDPNPTEGDTFFYNFDNVNNGNFGDWTAFQGGNSTSSNGWMTYDQHNYDLSGYGHNNSNGFVYSESYITGPNTAVNPDNYLVSPQVTLGSTSTLTFWATNISNQYGGEHFTVEVSTASNNTASDFVVVYETTEMSKGGSRSGRDLVNDGVWTEHNVDLSAYAGQQVYIAFHHFGSYDIWALCIDDVELANARNRDGIIGYNIYRSENNVDYALIATVGADVTEYYDNVEAGNYYYQVTALYDGCESAPAVAGLNPENNFVLVIVTGDGENTGLDENAGNVTLFPNPTKGNVTIQAQGMNRITVVSVLGQVVYDTELDQDEFILNMAQFNTGMYMVRVYTDGGVTVKRVTVMH